jgi:hypothetical protein
MNLFDWAYSLSMRSGLKYEVMDEDLEEYTTQNIKEGAVLRDTQNYHLRTDDTISVVREITCYQVLAMGDELDEQMEAKKLYSTMPKKDLFHRDKVSALNKYVSSEIDGHYDWLTPDSLWLEIDMSCSDKEIRIAFDEWLKQKKANDVDLNKKPKRREYKLNEFSKATLRRWHDARVLAYLDIEAWNYLKGNKITSKIMGDILFPEYKDERNNTGYINDTVKPLTDLLTCGDLHMRMRKIFIDTNRQKIS